MQETHRLCDFYYTQVAKSKVVHEQAGRFDVRLTVELVKAISGEERDRVRERERERARL